MEQTESSQCLSLYHDDKYETPSSGVDVLVFFVLDDHMLFFQKKRPVVSRAAHSRVAEKQVQTNRGEKKGERLTRLLGLAAASPL